LAGALVAPAASGELVAVTIGVDGVPSPPVAEVFHGDTVEWLLPDATRAVIPVAVEADGAVDCARPRPFDAADPNEFTGPLPRAASGLFSLGPEERPYASETATWASPSLTGVFIRPRWDDVHLAPGVFRWSEIDAEIEQAVRHGKLFSIGFKAGVKGTPAWIFEPARTENPATKLDLGFRQGGAVAWYGSPADPNFRKHYFDLLRAFAAHLRARNDWYRALAYIKPSGANLYTHENRLPNDTTDQLATWAGPGAYRPSAVYEFYDLQEELLAAEFPYKEMDFALIQDGFPRINEQGEYLGQVPAPVHPLPAGAGQTEELLARGRARHGLRFVVAHNGLMRQPEYCPGSGVHPIVVDPGFHYVASGCPNRWVLEQAALGQITGFQTTNDLLTDEDVDSALRNAWENSDGIYVELYERNAQQIEDKVLPSGLTALQWAARFHDRRRTAYPQVPDPFPAVHRHTFSRTAPGGAAQAHPYVTTTACATATAAQRGSVVVLPDFGFTSIAFQPDGQLAMELASREAGTLRVETTAPQGWRLLLMQLIGRGRVVVVDEAPPAAGSLYRATLLPP
jgi:hypothetical protein